MNRKKIKIVSVILCVCLLGGALYQSGVLKAGNIGAIDPAKISPKNDSAELGSAANPFTVLEIVPSHEMAQFGYFIPGCEPVNMERAKYCMDVKGEFTSTMSSIYDISDVRELAFYDQIPADPMRTVNPYGDANYMKRTDLVYSSEWAKYGQWRKAWDGSYSQTGDWVSAPGGGFALEWGNYVYKGEGQGDYRWVPSETGSSVRRPNGDLFDCSYIEYKHKDTFIPSAFDGATSENFHSQVITLTPAELEGYLTNDGRDVIDTAELIYIHAGSGNYSGIANIYYHLNDNGHTASDGTGANTKFLDAGYDLTYTEVMRIAERMASDNPAALIMDMTKMLATDDAKKEYNCHKLIYMTLLYRPEFFWSTFGNYLASYEGADGTAKVEYTKGETEGTYPPYRFWGVNETCEPWTYGGTTYPSVANPFMFHPTSGAFLIDNVRYYNIISGGNNIFDKIFTYQGDTATLQSLLTGGAIPNTSMGDNGLFTNNVTSDAFTDDNEGKSSLSFLDAIHFILYEASYTPKLRVLEIEGCDEYIYGSEGWETYYQALFPWYKPKSNQDNWLKDKNLIEVTTMPTWEFIGSTGRYNYDASSKLTTESSDDLIAKYDLILIGSKQNAANGAAGYNEYTDPKAGNSVDLGNLIYTSIGGTYTNGNVSEMNEATYSEQLDMRHAGNDITLKKLLELQDFLCAGKPIVVDSGLYSGSAVDTAKVDPDSKLYDLLSWNGSGSENRFIYGSINSSLMKKLVSQNVCRIEFYDDEGYPYEYRYTSDPDGTIRKVINSVKYDGDGNVVFDYHFYIQGNASDSYNVFLNLDLNGDGVYMGSLKEHSEVDNMNAATGSSYAYDTSEKMAGMEIYDAGWNYLGKTEPGSSTSYQLKASTEYYARYKLSSAVRGMIPWKLEVQSCTNPKLRSSAIDYTVVSAAEKERIAVLQMNLWPDMSVDTPVDGSRFGQNYIFTAFTRDSVTVNAGETYEDFVRRNADGVIKTDDKLYNLMNANQRQTVARFENYIDPVPEFDVDIQYLFNSDWYQLFGTSATGLENWKSFLADYDMLVFGFVDGSVFTSNPVFVEGVKDFVAQGKSMILSHDTMYGSNGTNVYGEYNSWLRTVSGQRRSFYNKTGSGTYEKSFNDVRVNGTTLTFVSDENIKDPEDADGNVTGENPYRKFFDVLKDTVDGGTVEPKFLGTWVNEWPDNETYLQICAQGTDELKSSLGSTERVTKDGRLGGYVWAHPYSRQTTYVKLTNNGQITSYPYKLNDVIEVLSTHTQYYQLDMEYQNQGDVNVWFTLSDMNDPEVKAYCDANHLTGETGQNIYSAKDQDCRNSFYIYNKGNITYTGSGHGEAYGFGQESALMTDDEVMLFVNTMISAYRQPESRPFTKVDKADAVASDGTAVLYLDYDGYQFDASAAPATPLLAASGAAKGGIDNRVVNIGGRAMVRIEFLVYDLRGNSDVTDKTYYIRLMHDGVLMDTGDVIVQGLDADGNPSGGALAALGSAANPYYQVNASETGVPYAMYVPYEDIQADNGVAKYTIGAYATYTKSGRFVTTATSNSNAQLMFLPLFSLN